MKYLNEEKIYEIISYNEKSLMKIDTSDKKQDESWVKYWIKKIKEAIKNWFLKGKYEVNEKIIDENIKRLESSEAQYNTNGQDTKMTDIVVENLINIKQNFGEILNQFFTDTFGKCMTNIINRIHIPEKAEQSNYWIAKMADFTQNPQSIFPEIMLNDQALNALYDNINLKKNHDGNFIRVNKNFPSTNDLVNYCKSQQIQLNIIKRSLSNGKSITVMDRVSMTVINMLGNMDMVSSEKDYIKKVLEFLSNQYLYLSSEVIKLLGLIQQDIFTIFKHSGIELVTSDSKELAVVHNSCEISII